MKGKKRLFTIRLEYKYNGEIRRQVQTTQTHKLKPKTCICIYTYYILFLRDLNKERKQTNHDCTASVAAIFLEAC